MRAAGPSCLALSSLLFAACGPGPDGPRFEQLEDQVVGVGDEIQIELRASNESGSAIQYNYSSDAKIGNRGAITVRPDGTGLFSWRPEARDVGTWTFDFTATDSQGTTTNPVVIDVRSTVGEDTLPVFNRPLGQGRTMNPSVEDCMEIELSVSDSDTAEVEFGQEEPLIEGANIAPQGGNEAFWRWCPTETQLRAQDRYILTLSADDGENPKVIKRYLIVLRDAGKPGCGGEAPEITHVARDADTVNSIEVTAAISDDNGLKGTPLLYYSTTPPSDPIEPSRMIQLSMELREGSDRDGTWAATIPNPITEAGGQSELYYAILAEDNDDRGGDCDHVTIQDYGITVTGSGGSGGLALCEPCDADLQCGGSGDLCVGMGVEGDSFCTAACSTDAECGDGFFCSPKAITSVDGAAARQCVPVDSTCAGASEPSCPDDSFEQNDSRLSAQALGTGTQSDLHICPVGNLGVDEDWYAIEVDADSEVNVSIDGETYPNLELRLYDDRGEVVAASEDWGSTDSVSRCLTPGTYHARVYSYFSGDNDYTISYTASPSSCTGGGMCTDDVYEDDDDSGSARLPDFEAFVYRASGNHICSGDDDWYYVYLFGDESVHGTLTFEQTSADEDLDFLIYDGGGELLTPCTVEDPFGCTDNGQSGDSNEEITFTAETAGDYYVVVRGWQGSENDYDICLSLQPGLCP